MKNTEKTKSYYRNTFHSYSGFTFVELLVSISILATISIVAYVSVSGYMKASNNATRITSIDSLHLSLSDYLQMKKVLPEPNSNTINYDERGAYAHSLTGAYGVSGYVSYNFLPSGYVNFEATDPESKQFYGYGKTLSPENPTFDVAAVLYDQVTGGYKTYIRGTYDKERLASLVRSYSSSNFVSQNSTDDLPYNPYDRKVTASVSSYSGSVMINTDPTRSLTGELNSGDKITVATGSTALIHISDGSELSLGSTTTETILSLTSLTYNDDNNLASRVSLLLGLGEIWVEAPHLRTETDSMSDFSIQTDSALAAVRGTVFGMTKTGSLITGTTSIALVSGKLEVAKILSDPTNPTAFDAGFSTTATGGFVVQNTSTPSAPGVRKSYMIVPEGGEPIQLGNIVKPSMSPTPPAATATGTLDSSDTDKKIQHPPFSLGYRPKPTKIEFSTGAVPSSTGTLSVTFYNPGADSYYLSFGTGKIDGEHYSQESDPNQSHTGSLDPVKGVITITGSFLHTPVAPGHNRTYALQICFQGKCSAPEIKRLGGDTFNFSGPLLRSKEDRKNGCDEGQKTFANLGCQDKDLVAYAPYDVAEKMYTSGSDIPAEFQSINDSGYEKYNLGAYTFYNNTTNESNLVSANLNSLGFSVNKLPNSIYGWGSYGTGIFLDNHNGILGNDFLKYTLPTNLLGDKFAIEMSVRGAALKRDDWGNTYQLFNFSGSTNSINLYVQIKHGQNFSGFHPVLDNDEFYQIKIDNVTGKCHISGKNLISTPCGTNSIVVGGTGGVSPNLLYIGSNSSHSNQWNDIIDSVKIRKY